jgi:hypothetical protein
MPDLLDISSRIVDSGVVDQPINRVTNELSELADDLAIRRSTLREARSTPLGATPSRV